MTPFDTSSVAKRVPMENSRRARSGRAQQAQSGSYAVKFVREAVIREAELRELVGEHGFSIANLSHRLNDDGKAFEYRMVIRSRNRIKAESLCQHLRARLEVREFRIAPTGD